MLEEWVNWRNEIAEYCMGRWQDIAPAICNDPRVKSITTSNVTCPEPNCGRTGKLYLVDPQTYSAHCCSTHCNKHYFDGVALIAELNGERETDTLKRIESYLGLKKSKSTKVVPFVRKDNVSADAEAKPVPNQRVVKKHKYLLSTLENAAGTLVTKYLFNRGIDCTELSKEAIAALNFHPNLRYYAEILENDVVVGEEKGQYPAMVAKVFNSEMSLIGFHQTFLSPEGNKADVTKPKQLTSRLYKNAYGEKGCFIPLCKPIDGRYGIAEGIETSLALVAMKRPCWSVLSATGIKNFVVPDDCKVLDLYGDLDASGTGQMVIIDKYIELREKRPDVQVNMYLPPEKYWDHKINPKGIDFLDVNNQDKHLLPPLF